MLYYLASKNYTHTDAFHMSIATVHTQTKKSLMKYNNVQMIL